jgi:hypothetical protein
MDHRGNMSNQHRRSKINHSVKMGAELTEDQTINAKKRKKLTKMSIEESDWSSRILLHSSMVR